MCSHFLARTSVTLDLMHPGDVRHRGRVADNRAVEVVFKVLRVMRAMSILVTGRPVRGRNLSRRLG
jgi:hypothetical protein